MSPHVAISEANHSTEYNPIPENVTAEKKRWHLNLRTLALAQPKRLCVPKYIRREEVEHVVSKAALRAKSTPRLAALAEPHKLNKKYDPVEAAKPTPIVRKTALTAICSVRNDMLSRNLPSKLERTLQMYSDRGDFLRSNLKKYIELGKTSMYREMYWPKPPPPPTVPPYTRSCMYMNDCEKPKSREQMKAELIQWCNLRSQPKPVLEPPPLPLSKKKPLAEMKKRINIISQPRYIYEKFDEQEAKRYTTGITRLALLYKPSARVQILAKPKKVYVLPPRPEGVNPDALTAVTTARIKELAKPRPRAQGDNEEKDNPYLVKPEALTAWCSPRMKELALPKGRK